MKQEEEIIKLLHRMAKSFRVRNTCSAVDGISILSEEMKRKREREETMVKGIVEAIVVGQQ